MNKVLYTIACMFLSVSICACTVPEANPGTQSEQITNTDKTPKNISESAQGPRHQAMPQFYYAKSVDELLNWIRTADVNGDDYARAHFLGVARQFDQILTVDAQNSGYTLDKITVHPDNEYMHYHFIDENDKNNAIYINIKLPVSNGATQFSAKAVAQENFKTEIEADSEQLNSLYEDAPQYEQSAVTIEGEQMPLYYYDGRDCVQKDDEELGLLFTTAKFDTGEAQVTISLHGTYPNGLFYEKWDDRYFDLFHFNTVDI